jgi:hypothetical protein
MAKGKKVKMVGAHKSHLKKHKGGKRRGRKGRGKK